MEKQLAPSATAKQAGSSSGPVLRANRQKRLRRDLVSAGLELFMEQGYEETTVAEIAERVDVSRRTFFRHFQSKDDLVFDWMGQLGERVQPVLAARPLSETPLQAMRETFLVLAEHLVEEERQARTLIRLIFSTASLAGRYHDEHAQWEDEFVSILQRHRNLPELALFQLRVQVSAAITAFVVAVRTWAGQDAQSSLPFWLEQAFAALDGCGGAAGTLVES